MLSAFRGLGAIALALSCLWASVPARTSSEAARTSSEAARTSSEAVRISSEAARTKSGVAGTAQEPTRRVLIIGMDGLRTDALLAASAPNLHRLIREGSFTPDALADRITRSGPGWASILTGSWSPKHGVEDNMLAGYRRERFPHFFRRIKLLRPGAFTASIVNWAPIHEKLVADADLSLAFGNDDSVAVASVRLLTGSDPDVLFLQFDAPDHAGHRWGFSRFSPPYMRAIKRTDARIGKVLASLAARHNRRGEEWLILCVTDHGGTLRHHGEDIPSCRRIPLIMAGDGTLAGARIQGVGLVDVAPTVLEYLGLEAAAEWSLDGHPIPSGSGTVDDRLSRQTPYLLEDEIR